jgi:integrase
MSRSGFGNVRKLPSGRWQARYTAPGGRTVTAPMTFDAKIDALGWLATKRADLVRGAWLPADSSITFREYSTTWLAQRSLKPRTRDHYRRLLDAQILPTLGSTSIRLLSPALVRDWHAGLDPTTPTVRSHSYALLKAICATAVADDLLPANPCRVRGAGQAKRASRTEPASLDELAVLVAAMPDRYRLMTLLAAWCGLRFGELTELRGKDIDLRTSAIRIRRAVVHVDGKAIVSTPKSGAGVRDVAIPPHLMPAVRTHLAGHGRDQLLFPAAGDPQAHMRPATLYRVYYPAREKAGRPDLRWHDLRHTGAVLAAATGATLAELMGRLGHSTPAAALRYQHAARGRDAEIAALLSKLAEADTT